MTIRSRMRFVASRNINQLVPNFVKIYMTLGSQMSSIMGVIRPEQLELFALELESSLEYFLVRSITLSSPFRLT